MQKGQLYIYLYPLKVAGVLGAASLLQKTLKVTSPSRPTTIYTHINTKGQSRVNQ